MQRLTTLAAAFLFGLMSIVLLFVLGEGVRVPPSLPGATFWQALVFLGPQAIYFSAVAYFLTKLYHPLRYDWLQLSMLVAPVFLSTVLTLVVESDKRNALQPAAVTVLGAIFCWLGAWLAFRRLRVGA